MIRKKEPALDYENAVKQYFGGIFKEFAPLPYKCKCGDTFATKKISENGVTVKKRVAIMGIPQMLLHIRNDHGERVKKSKLDQT